MPRWGGRSPSESAAGKTMLAKAIATEAKAHFINITMGVVATLPLAVTPAVRGGGGLVSRSDPLSHWERGKRLA